MEIYNIYTELTKMGSKINNSCYIGVNILNRILYDMYFWRSV